MEKKGNWFKDKFSKYKFKGREKLNKQIKWEKELSPFTFRSFILQFLLLLTLYLSFLFAIPIYAALALIAFLMILIFYLEYEFYSLPVILRKRGKKVKEKNVLVMIALKEVFISFLLVILGFLIITILFPYIPLKFEERVSLNLFILLTFAFSFTFYYFYTKYKIAYKVLKLFHRVIINDKEMIEKDKLKKSAINFTDLFAILATILLLNNSIVSLIYPLELENMDFLVSTFEFKFHLIVLSNYIPAIYFRIPQ